MVGRRRRGWHSGYVEVGGRLGGGMVGGGKRMGEVFGG